MALLAPKGCLVTIVNLMDVDELQKRGVNAQAVFVRPDREQLGQLRQMFDNDRLHVHVEKAYPLAEAAAAQDQSQAGHVRGKLVLLT